MGWIICTSSWVGKKHGVDVGEEEWGYWSFEKQMYCFVGVKRIVVELAARGVELIRKAW